MEIFDNIAKPSFIEYGLQYNNLPGSINLDTYGIDAIKLASILSKDHTQPLWLDFSTIALPGFASSTQLDLLGSINEAFVIYKPSNIIYLFKLLKSIGDISFRFDKMQIYLINNCLIYIVNELSKIRPAPEDTNIDYVQIIKNQGVKINYLNDELTKANLRVENYYSNLINFLFKDELGAERKITLSDSTLEFLISNNPPISELYLIFKNAFLVAKELSPNNSEIRIRKYYLLESPLTKFKEKIPSKSVQKDLPKPIINSVVKTIKPVRSSQSKLNRTISLLDRYETAIELLIKQKQPILGKNIANSCIPPISSPALTDSINKHRQRIKDCMVINPTKWPLLKNNYAPIQKIIQAEQT